MKDKSKIKIVEPKEGVDYINQFKYSKIVGKSPQAISYYVKKGKIEVVKKRVNGKIRYYISKDAVLPTGLKAGRPKGS